MKIICRAVAGEKLRGKIFLEAASLIHVYSCYSNTDHRGRRCLETLVKRERFKFEGAGFKTGLS